MKYPNELEVRVAGTWVPAGAVHHPAHEGDEMIARFVDPDTGRVMEGSFGADDWRPNEAPGGDEETGVHLDVTGDVASIELRYPPRGEPNGRVSTVQIELEDVRSAWPMRVRYDFERDGWVVLRPRFTAHPDLGCIGDVDEWTEAAFLEAWPDDEAP